MQYRIQRPGAQRVTMTAQFLDHLQTEDRPSGRVMQDMHADKGQKHIAYHCIVHRYQCTISILMIIGKTPPARGIE
jgi:hypothetical protein